MSNIHSRLDGNNLHAPATQKIINNTGSDLNPNDQVFLGVTRDSDGFITITRLASSSERVIGIVEDEVIYNGAKGVVLVQGRHATDTSAFSAGTHLAIDGAGGFITTGNPNTTVAYVVNSAVEGEVVLDTFAIPGVSSSSSSLETLSDVNITDVANDQLLSYENGFWINRNSSDVSNIANIEEGAGGLVTITFNDGTDPLVVQAGQRLSYEGLIQTYRPNKEYIGNVNIVDDVASETSKIYVQAVEPAASEDPANNNVSTIIDTGLGGDDNLQPTIAGRNIRNNDGTLDLGISGSTAPDEADTFIDLDSPVLSRLTDSTVADSGIDNIADVIITTPTVKSSIRVQWNCLD